MNQTIIAFNKGYQGIGSILQRHSSNGFLLVCGNSFNSLNISSYFDTIKIPHSQFTEFTANPKLEQVELGVKLFRDLHFDAILAVGGGSTIDVAKCIKHFCGLNNVTLIAIPTTAGTGSESTSFAVAYKNGIKHSFDTGLPEYAILEESVLKSLPLYQKKATLFDALCQGIESLWSKHATNDSREYANKAINLIMKNHHKYLHNSVPDNAVLMEMMQASNYSGRAINISKTTAAHAMSYGITSMFNIPHGYAVALCIVAYWKYLETKMSTISFQIPIDIDSFVRLMETYSVFSKYDCADDQIQILTDAVNVERLNNSPVIPTVEDIKSVYNDVFGHKNGIY